MITDFNFSAHIFFDDAFEISDENDDWSQVNGFVKDFIECLDESGAQIYKDVDNFKLGSAMGTVCFNMY